MTKSEGSLVIKPIEKDVVNRICSGQVILSLATAVKELVENSIDAKATSIQIRLKEYGSENVEVIDNGCGVEEKNFQALTLKHYTSKISDFTDVASVETFGFRGEALSSLCTLSKVSITTRHKDSETGTKLKFDQNGIIVESSKIARQTGTTVTLENIFHTLPVRHKEFQRNIKKEFSKMCNVLYAYGLLCKGVSIVCTNQVSGKRLTVMESMGESLKSNITQIFGAKQSQNLLEIKEILPGNSNTDNDDGDDDDGNSEEKKLKLNSLIDIKLEGFVSSCSHGAGRSSSDRQFYYINSRPVDNIKVSKLVNDIYHQYNPHQYPFIVLNMKLSMECVDVNVTPDKRLIFMKNEKHLLSVVEASLHELFQNIPAVVKIQNVGVIGETKTETLRSEGSSDPSPLEKLKQFRSRSYCSDNSKRVEKKSNSDGKKWKTRSSRSTFESMPSIREIFIKSSQLSHETPQQVKFEEESDEENIINEDGSSVLDSDAREKESKPISAPRKTEELEPISTMSTSGEQSAQMMESVCTKRKAPTDAHLPENDVEEEIKRVKTDDGMTEDLKGSRKSLTLDVRLDDIKKSRDRRLAKHEDRESSTEGSLRFYAQINPSQNESAEKELMRELRKETFKEMRIIGQFNMGFIIAALGPDVFIIDQHATDEKYNFETLQRTTKIQTQRLVVPQSLNLTIEKEELMLHHADVIKQNGFDFEFDSSEKPTKRVKLTCVPLSKNWVFGKEDIDEMLFILENAADGKFCRPSRVRAMFASRACRKSVMIGTALNHFEMRRLVDHMGEIEQPWNCPHGRPTIRHLLNLDLVKKA